MQKIDKQYGYYDKALLEKIIPCRIEGLKAKYYDSKFRIQTQAEVELLNERKINFSYEPTPYSFLEYFFTMNPFCSSDHIVDFGCGKGRVIVMASYFSCKSITGIEINDSLYADLSANIKAYQESSRCRTKFCLINDDAANVEIDNSANIFFFSNPFHLKIYIKVVSQIKKSLLRTNRPISIVLYMPHRSTLDYLNRLDWLKIADTELAYGNLSLYVVYKNYL